MNKTKAKFNVEKIMGGRTIYPKDFIELVNKYKDQIIEVEVEIFGGSYELELEGRTLSLCDSEIILL